MGDIYSFGMVMYEILFRALPFSHSTNIDELVEHISTGERVCRPSIQDKTEIHPDLTALLLDCWNENPEIRPSIRRVRLNTECYLKVKGSLVDQMMRMMEQYANNLEKLVQERTGMLEDANARADKLLSQLLPHREKTAAQMFFVDLLNILLAVTVPPGIKKLRWTGYTMIMAF
ncbi:Receptor-type guanylate cyclase gcy-23 [Parelaphostrongylus tenuis]|uniref:guanylate cyclase n=1 Tax=Parelaphostrongylus tenuis TaxID=148309 RepID=A0AAD5QQ14_PARTN|nr:Receptor-type guanylate cyclase gcy-23 [Parelaphostrongylus tenuis]